MIYDVIVHNKSYRLELRQQNGRWLCRLDGREIEMDAATIDSDVLSLRVANKSYEVKRELLDIAGKMRISIGAESADVQVHDPRSLRGRTRAADDAGVKKLTAHMPGKVVRVLVEPGAQVEAGAGVIVVEAMKMQNEIKSPKQGKIQQILVKEGSAVNAGDVLAIVE